MIEHKPRQLLYKILKHLVAIALFFIFSSLAFLAGYWITTSVYQSTGRPVEAMTHVLSGIVGFLILFFTIAMAQIIFKYSSWGKKFNHSYVRIFEAMQQISQGNFNVLLNPKEENRLQDFASAINEMAINLGNLETMRQDFISNVSHEIQSPLTSINGFATLLQQENLSPEGLHYAQVIEAESKRLSLLSANLLKLTSLDNKKIPLNKNEFKLTRQLENVALTLEPQWRQKNITVEAKLEKVSYYGDENLLSQVWINLLHNAIKFTPDNLQIRMSLTTKNDWIIITISDSGIGIAPNDQIHIFERFFKVDKSRNHSLGGSGLGLAIVKKIVELHDGKITVESKIDRGATFIISLPCLHSV